ncbi:MAG: hypothetical protein ABI898_04660 [Sphingomonadales bacterium]
MGASNLRQSLKTKMGHWAYEVQEHAEEIARIESLFERLDGLREQEDHLRYVLQCADVVMTEVDPDWKAGQVKPVRQHVHKSSVRPGQTAKLALDILRQATVPLPTRAIAIEVLRRNGDVAPDKEMIRGAVNAVDATLRAKEKIGLVKHTDDYGRSWFIAV